jgi:hypothetical protein
MTLAEMSDGYLLSGYEGDGNPIGNKDALLVKIWDNGTIAWQNRYSDTCDELTAIDKTSDYGFILAGGGCLYKVNSLGERQWSKPFYGPYRIHSVKETDYGYLLSGTTQEYPEWEGNLGFVYKTDFEGNLMWQKLYSTNYIAFSAIPITSGGDYLVAGSKYGSCALPIETLIIP